MERQRGGRRHVEPDLPDFGDLGPKLRRWLKKWWSIPVGIVMVIWLANGIYSVGPGSQGVVRQFGREVAKTDAGLHWVPRGIQKATVVDLASVRRLNIGFEEVRPGQFKEVPSEALMLTKDENIVNVHVIIQYRVLDASQFLFKVRDVPGVLRTATEVALRSVVGNVPIDDVLTERRAEVQDETKVFLQRLTNEYGAGVTITELKLQEVDAPQEVRDSFHEVVRAREDKERLVRESEGYQADLVPRARGEKEKTVKAAEAYKEQRILRAGGDADKFLAVLKEYQKAKYITRQRLYLETIETVLPGIDKIIINSGTASNLLPFLPLRSAPGVAGQIVPQAAEGEQKKQSTQGGK